MRYRWGLINWAGVLLAIAACAPAEPEPPPEPQSGPAEMQRFTLQHDGLAREYFVYLPGAYDGERDLPLLMFLHGYGGTATGTEAEVTQGLNAYAEKFSYVLVYPQGTWFAAGTPDRQWTVTSWNHISDGFDNGPAGPICTADADRSPCPPECGDCGACGWASCNDDVGFLKVLVGELLQDFAVDASSVFVAGFSNGAMMANRIACDASELFAGAALVGGRVEPGFECTPTKALPLLQINGGKDKAVPHDGQASSGGFLFASTTSITEHWTAGATCAANAEAWTSATLAGHNVQCTLACGDSERAVTDCLWPEGNHRWPGTSGFRGSNGYCVSELQAASMPGQAICLPPDPDASFWGSELMFEFFDARRGR